MGNAVGGFDMNVRNAWLMGYAGRNVSISILDDGIQVRKRLNCSIMITITKKCILYHWGAPQIVTNFSYGAAHPHRLAGL